MIPRVNEDTTQAVSVAKIAAGKYASLDDQVKPY